jgi:type I restriction enzyme R subunit
LRRKPESSRTQKLKINLAELNTDELPQLLELKYRAIRDPVKEFGPVPDIRQMFIGFQRYLYEEEDAIA